MSFLSARDFTLVMLAIVFFAGAGCIALLTPLPAQVNAWAATGFSAVAFVMLFLLVFPNWLRRLRKGQQDELRKEAPQPVGRSASSRN